MKIDYKAMRKICLANIVDFEGLGEANTTPDGIFVHRKSENSKVLGVAHLDTVLTSNHFQVINKKKDTRVYNMQLDDRLGVYTLLDLLPQVGINCDILLTEGEETGNSTAQYFESGKYNWIFSFDRRGDDAVLYSYQDNKINEWEKALISSKFKIGIGSFSDIAFMEHLGVKGVNIGTGYIGEHSRNCYASMNTLLSQVQKFKNFYETNKDTKFPHSERQIHYGFRESYWDYGLTKYNPYYKDDTLGCYLCEEGVGINSVNGVYLCDACFASAGICQECDDIFPDTDLMHGLCMDCNYNISRLED